MQQCKLNIEEVHIPSGIFLKHDRLIYFIFSISVIKPYAAVGYFGQYKMMQKHENDWNPGTLVLIWETSARAIQRIPTWQGLEGFSKNLSILVLWTKVALALEGLRPLPIPWRSHTAESPHFDQFFCILVYSDFLFAVEIPNLAYM